MAILVTGGTGFVGGTLVRLLTKKIEDFGYEKEDIFVLVRENSNIDELKKLGVELIIGDLTNSESLVEAVKGKKIVFHLGAVVLDQSDPEMFWKVNVDGTKSLMDAVKDEKSIEKFVLVSTWGIYGYKVKAKPMTENQPFDPTNEYHKSKAEAEKLVWEIANENKVPVAVARLPMILGKGDTLTTPRVIEAFFNKKVKQIGNGKNMFSAVHVEDAAKAILAMGFNKNGTGNAYNVKSFDLSQYDYWHSHMEAINYNEKIPVFPRWLAMFYAWTKEVGAKLKGLGKPTLTRHRVMRYGNTRILDISKLENDLDWSPDHKDGNVVIKESVKWLIEQKYIDLKNKEVVLLRRWEDLLKRKNKKTEK